MLLHDHPLNSYYTIFAMSFFFECFVLAAVWFYYGDFIPHDVPWVFACLAIWMEWMCVFSFANYLLDWYTVYTCYIHNYSRDLSSITLTFIQISLACLPACLFTCLLLLPITNLNTNKDSFIMCASINLKLSCLIAM